MLLVSFTRFPLQSCIYYELHVIKLKSKIESVLYEQTKFWICVILFFGVCNFDLIFKQGLQTFGIKVLHSAFFSIALNDLKRSGFKQAPPLKISFFMYM